MHVAIVQPPADAFTFLAGAQFADAYSVTADDTAMTARTAAERMFARQPGWVNVLLTMRDRIVMLFGLKTSDMARRATADRVGIFPVISETPDRIIAGLDDRHLDFRVIVEITDNEPRLVTATTVVLTHNLLGRVYLAIIMPFHRLIVRAMLRQIADTTANP